jgi:hypothetical protein
MKVIGFYLTQLQQIASRAFRALREPRPGRQQRRVAGTLPSQARALVSSHPVRFPGSHKIDLPDAQRHLRD